MLSSHAYAATITHPKAVVEVFTSQGCYSCPPADKIIGDFAKTNEILAIGRHVTYWDYLGWKDTFGLEANTKHQYAYARSLRERQVYTPQAVVNGQTHTVGSNKGKILSEIDKLSSRSKGMVVPINVAIDSKNMNIKIADKGKAKGATLYVFSMKCHETVDIPRGENAGKKLTYHHILRKVHALAMVKKGGIDLQYPLSELKQDGNDCHALVLQTLDRQGNPSKIVGAAVVKDL